MQMAKVMTVAGVKALQPGKITREVPDGGSPGLRLVVQPSGKKSWAMRFRRPDGRQANLTLGPLDLSGKEIAGEPTIGAPLSLIAARRVATEVLRQRALGRDIAADITAAKLRQKAEREERGANVFGAAVKRYVEDYAQPKTRSWAGTARYLGLSADLKPIAKGLADRWRDRPVSEITSLDVHNVIDETRRIGVPGLARRQRDKSESRAEAMFASLSRAFSWMVEERLIEKSPMIGVRRPDISTPRDRVLTDDEVRWFWTACETLSEPFGPLLQLLLLTGQRRDEIAAMRRTELSEDDEARPILMLAASRTKNGLPHTVPLSPLALRLIARVRMVEGPSDFVFSTTRKSPVSGWSKTKERLDARMLELAKAEKADAQIEAWVIHDLRRTFASGMQRLGVQMPVTERLLNHISGSFSGVAGVYQRHEYAEERRIAMECWSERVEAIVAQRETKVLPFAAVKSTAEK
jgi:integrase